MKDTPQLLVSDKRRSHELKTLGGFISPVWAVAEEILGTDPPEEFKHQLKQIRVETKALLDEVVKKSFEKTLEELDVGTFKEFYHQRFIAWKRALGELVSLLDRIPEAHTSTSTQIQKSRELSEKLKKFLKTEERNVL